MVFSSSERFPNGTELDLICGDRGICITTIILFLFSVNWPTFSELL